MLYTGMCFANIEKTFNKVLKNEMGCEEERLTKVIIRVIMSEYKGTKIKVKALS